MEQGDGGHDGIPRRDVLKLAGAVVVGIGGAALAASPALAATGGGGTPPGINVFSLAAAGVAAIDFANLVEVRMAVARSEGRPEGQPFVVVFTTAARLAADFYAWFAAAVAGKKTAFRPAVLTGYDSSGTPLIKWDLTGAFPSQIVASSSGSMPTTEVTLLAESIIPA